MYKSAVENAIALNNVEDGTYIVDSEGNIQYKNKKIKIDIKNYKLGTGIVIIEKGQIKDIKLTEDNKIVDNKEQYNIDIWDGESKTEVVKSEDNIYHITKSSELAWLANEVNNGNAFEGEIISLDKSLNLNNKEWTPIGNSVNFFKGTFEGNNNIISGIYINKSYEIEEEDNNSLGLFAEINSAEVRNLIIKDSYVSGYNTVSIFSANVKNSIIDNITVLNSVVNSYTYGGPIIGVTEDSSLTNLYSYNNKIIGCDIFIGGIVGSLTYSNLTLAYSNSNVKMLSDIALSRGSGGIVGLASNSIITNSISEATVIGNERVGGIVGHFRRDSQLINSKSYAKVSGTNMIGGVIGVFSGYPNGNTLENIESYAEVEGVEEVGGIIGNVSQGNNNITNIYSKAKIKGTNKVGGIVGGFYESYETILNYKNVISESEIIGESNTGKLWGYVDSTTILNELN